jgi:hypothetical protein
MKQPRKHRNKSTSVLLWQIGAFDANGGSFSERRYFYPVLSVLTVLAVLTVLTVLTVCSLYYLCTGVVICSPTVPQ